MRMKVTDRRIKWLILLIPTLTIGLWEYIRHAFLLPYISMELGNMLAPFIVLAVTLTLVRRLFERLEQSQEALRRERELSASLEQREQLARELHDGIAQSLFLLAVKLDRLERTVPAGEEKVRTVAAELRSTVKEIDDDLRQAIANLRMSPTPADAAWVMPLRELLSETAALTEAEAEFRWTIPEHSLSHKEKAELHACLREALINVRKHARASKVVVVGNPSGEGGFRCSVEDDGVGFHGDPLAAKERFGLRMVRDRCRRMAWLFAAERRGDHTVVEIAKRGEALR